MYRRTLVAAIVAAALLIFGEAQVHSVMNDSVAAEGPTLRMVGRAARPLAPRFGAPQKHEGRGSH